MSRSPRYLNFFVSSAKRSASDSVERFAVSIANSSTRKVDAFAAARIVIPNAMHNVNQWSTSITYTENGTSKTINVLPGFYTPISLAEEIEAKLVAAAGSAVYTVVADDETRSFTVTYSGAGASVTTGGTLLPILGITVGSWATDLAGGRIWNLAGPTSLFICIEGIGVKGAIAGEIEAQELQTIARVPVDVTHGEVIRANNTLAEWDFHSLRVPTDLPRVLNVKLIDSNGNQVSMNNVNYEFELIVRTVA